MVNRAYGYRLRCLYKLQVHLLVTLFTLFCLHVLSVLDRRISEHDVRSRVAMGDGGGSWLCQVFAWTLAAADKLCTQAVPTEWCIWPSAIRSLLAELRL